MSTMFINYLKCSAELTRQEGVKSPWEFSHFFAILLFITRYVGGETHIKMCADEYVHDL